MNIPENLRYTEDHEWARIEDGVATIGITAFAVEQLGDITLVELPAVGTAVAAHDSIGTVESVKAVSDLFSPLTGKVVEINEELEDVPENVNDAPYGAGWMLKIALADPGEVDGLIDAAGYRAHLDSLED